jgi:hypothetical protein
VLANIISFSFIMHIHTSNSELSAFRQTWITLTLGRPSSMQGRTAVVPTAVDSETVLLAVLPVRRPSSAAAD